MFVLVFVDDINSSMSEQHVDEKAQIVAVSEDKEKLIELMENEYSIVRTDRDVYFCIQEDGEVDNDMRYCIISTDKV